MMNAKGVLPRLLIVVFLLTSALALYQNPAGAADSTTRQGERQPVGQRGKNQRGPRVRPEGVSSPTRDTTERPVETDFSAILVKSVMVRENGSLRDDVVARGLASVHINDTGTKFSFSLQGMNLIDLTGVSILCSPTGPAGVTLFSGGPVTVQTWQTFAGGIITTPDVGNACGWTTVNEVVSAMRAGNTYVLYKTLAAPNGLMRGVLHSSGNHRR